MEHEFEEEERTPLIDANRFQYHAPAIDNINSESIKRDQVYFIFYGKRCFFFVY